MSLPREEILKELELWPVWRPRVAQAAPDAESQAPVASPIEAADIATAEPVVM